MKPGDVVLVNGVNGDESCMSSPVYAVVVTPSYDPHPYDFCAWVVNPGRSFEDSHTNDSDGGWLFYYNELVRHVPEDEVPDWVWTEYAKWQLVGDNADAS